MHEHCIVHAADEVGLLWYCAACDWALADMWDVTRDVALLKFLCMECCLRGCIRLPGLNMLPASFTGGMISCILALTGHRPLRFPLFGFAIRLSSRILKLFAFLMAAAFTMYFDAFTTGRVCVAIVFKSVCSMMLCNASGRALFHHPIYLQVTRVASRLCSGVLTASWDYRRQKVVKQC